MARKKERIPVTESQRPLAGNPFGDLKVEGLKVEAPEVPDQSKIGNLDGVRGPIPSLSKISLGRVVLRREKARRGGKTVIVVSDFAAHFAEADLEELARKAKQACACGGAVAGREIELQGDDAGRVRAFFEREGFRVAGI